MNNVITICATILAIVFCALLVLHNFEMLSWFSLIVGGGVLAYTIRGILPNKHNKLDLAVTIFEIIAWLFK